MSDHTRAKRQADATVANEPLPPTVSIYQNPDYVEGLLQQIYGQPLLTEFATENSYEGEQSDADTAGGQARAELSARFPGLFGGGAAAEANYEKRLATQRTIGNTSTSRAHYTQPYYLHVVRSAMRQAGLIRQVEGKSDAQTLTPGEFIEFTAAFRPSQISAILDIATPDLVEQIVRKVVYAKGMLKFQGGDLEATQRFTLKLNGDVDGWAAIGRAATEAVRADFRSTKTREFYGAVGSGADDAITFITMCDAEHFVVEDEDRILDGHFTVLGKVAGPMVSDEPILSRNKVLERIRPEAVDQLVEAMNESVRSQTDAVNAYAQGEADSEDTDTGGAGAAQQGGEIVEGQADSQDLSDPADVFDIALDPRVAGASIRVMPIAIYL